MPDTFRPSDGLFRHGQSKKQGNIRPLAKMIVITGVRILMQDSESLVDKSSSKASDKENIRGYIPRHCDLKCYKCRHQGDCVILRRIIEARRRYLRNSMAKNTASLLNDIYGLNAISNLRKYGNRFSRYVLAKLLRKRPRDRRMTDDSYMVNKVRRSKNNKREA